MILHGNATSLTDMFVFYWDHLPLHHSWSDSVGDMHPKKWMKITKIDQLVQVSTCGDVSPSFLGFMPILPSIWPVSPFLM